MLRVWGEGEGPEGNPGCAALSEEGSQAMSEPEVQYDAGRIPVANLITEVCQEICEMLVAKNRAYGNSALDPVRIFSKADPDEQLNVRIDDKLSRLVRGTAAGEDVELDLIGYLILKRVRRKARSHA